MANGNKSFWMASTDVSRLGDKSDQASAILGNCTTNIPLKFEFDPKDNGHTIAFGTTREGMSGMLSGTRYMNDEARDSEAGERVPLHIIDSGPCNARTSRELWEALPPDVRAGVTAASKEDPDWLNPFTSISKA